MIFSHAPGSCQQPAEDYIGNRPIQVLKKAEVVMAGYSFSYRAIARLVYD